MTARLDRDTNGTRPDPRVTVIVVTFNARAYVERCLASLRGQEAHELIVVDNGSSDGTREMLERRFGERLLKLDNPGFGAANNAAARRARGRYLLLLNSDCELGPDAIRALADHLDESPSTWLVAPRLHCADGAAQRSVGRTPTLTTELLNKSMLHRCLPVFTYGRWGFTGEREVDWATGACAMVRACAFRAVGGFDEGFFMFMEDLDLCARLRAAGGRLWFTDTVRALHHGGASSREVPVKARMLVEGERASRRYFRKHHGERATIAIRVMTVLATALRCLVWLPGLALPRYRPSAVARLLAYPRVAWDAATPDRM